MLNGLIYFDDSFKFFVNTTETPDVFYLVAVNNTRPVFKFLFNPLFGKDPLQLVTKHRRGQYTYYIVTLKCVESIREFVLLVMPDSKLKLAYLDDINYVDENKTKLVVKASKDGISIKRVPK